MEDSPQYWHLPTLATFGQGSWAKLWSIYSTQWPLLELAFSLPASLIGIPIFRTLYSSSSSNRISLQCKSDHTCFTKVLSALAKSAPSSLTSRAEQPSQVQSLGRVEL